MQAMTGIERITNLLQHKPVDRIGLSEHFWGDTQKVWTEQGHIQGGRRPVGSFRLRSGPLWAFNLVADLDFEPQVIEETDETILTRDGNGALFRRHKLHDSTPEHVDFLVKDRARMGGIRQAQAGQPDRRRINFEAYREAKRHAREKQAVLLLVGRQCVRVHAPRVRPPVHADGHGPGPRTGSRIWSTPTRS